VALNFVITYTCYGFFLGLITPGLLIASYFADRGRTPGDRRWLAGCFVASLASLGSYFVSYLHQTAAQCDSLWSASPVQYFWFVDLLYATTCGTRSIGIVAKAVGLLVLVLVVAVAVAGWRKGFGATRRGRDLHTVALVLTAYSILFCISGALGRTCMGLETTLASRHINYVQLGIVGLYFGSLAVNRTDLRRLLPAALLIALLPSLRVSARDTMAMQYNAAMKNGWRSCYLSGHKIAECDQAFAPIYPTPEGTHLQEKLDYLQANGLNLFSNSRPLP